jgi:hypothetical protein
MIASLNQSVIGQCLWLITSHCNHACINSMHTHSTYVCTHACEATGALKCSFEDGMSAWIIIEVRVQINTTDIITDLHCINNYNPFRSNEHLRQQICMCSLRRYGGIWTCSDWTIVILCMRTIHALQISHVCSLCIDWQLDAHSGITVYCVLCVRPMYSAVSQSRYK